MLPSNHVHETLSFLFLVLAAVGNIAVVEVGIETAIVFHQEKLSRRSMVSRSHHLERRYWLLVRPKIAASELEQQSSVGIDPWYRIVLATSGPHTAADTKPAVVVVQSLAVVAA